MMDFSSLLNFLIYNHVKKNLLGFFCSVLKPLATVYSYFVYNYCDNNLGMIAGNPWDDLYRWYRDIFSLLKIKNGISEVMIHSLLQRNCNQAYHLVNQMIIMLIGLLRKMELTYILLIYNFQNYSFPILNNLLYEVRTSEYCRVLPMAQWITK